MNYYNEFNEEKARWIEGLITRGLVPFGHVDKRSIVDVSPSDLKGYTQCHFFAGIGGWSYALQLAKWSADRPVWTGSCPCQPFSIAGQGLAQEDERHLWPVFFNLIRKCHPECIFGEQVADAIKHGWFDELEADLDSENYTTGGIVLGAHSAGAPHIRKRLYWVAHSNSSGVERLEPCKGSGLTGQWNWCGKEDLQTLVSNPFAGNDRWPQPLLRSMDDGVSSRMVGCHAFGDAIVPQIAAEFIKAYTHC